MSKILVVFGATGQQGSSVVSYVKERMSDKFKIRATTRALSKPGAKALQESGVEVVEGQAIGSQLNKHLREQILFLQ